MSHFYSVLVKGAVGGVAMVALTGCQMMASNSSSFSSSVVNSSTGKLVPGERLKGELTTRSPLNVKDGSRYEMYRFSLEAGSIVEIEVDGSFESVLSLYDDEDALLMTDSSVRLRSEDGGDYAVVVSGDSSDSYGPFSISSQNIELNDTGVLVVPGTTSGWLQSEPRSYTFTVSENSAYQIDVVSADFDSVLVMEGPNGYYTENDDGGEDNNARMGDLLVPGEYTLTVGSYEGRQGLFDIKISSLDIQITETDTLVLGSEITGWMSAGSDSYSLEIEEEGEYQIDMRSLSLDSVLVIEGPDGFYAEDDDGGEDYNSRIVETLKPGSYQVNAHRHPESEAQSGVYSLYARRR